jgi:hypothetical protein
VDDIVGFDITPMLFGTLALVMLPAIANATSSIQAQSYTGRVTSKTLTATGELRWLDIIHDEEPYIPWVCAYFVNMGPGTVDIAINYPADRFTLRKNETITIYRYLAREKIAIIFYICTSGDMATVRVTGEY